MCLADFQPGCVKNLPAKRAEGKSARSAHFERAAQNRGTVGIEINAAHTHPAEQQPENTAAKEAAKEGDVQARAELLATLDVEGEEDE